MSEQSTIKILYVDDILSVPISKYLFKFCEKHSSLHTYPFKLEYQELKFEPNSDYKDFLNAQEFKESDIILLDSQLYENRNSAQRFQGEEIKLIIKKQYPHKEVIIITQNEVDHQTDIVEKFDDPKNGSNLEKILDTKIKSIIANRKAIQKFIDNPLWDPCVKEQMSGVAFDYEELTVKDIDRLIDEFLKLESVLYGNK